MALTLEEMRLINAARKARLSPDAQARVQVKATTIVTPVTSGLTSSKRSATVKPTIKVKDRWEARPLYKLGTHILGPVPVVWCKVSTPRVNRGLEKRRHNQSKYATATFRPGTSVLYA